MKYRMHLTATPFEKIRNGSKKIELRLYDEKRKKIKPGDTILFINVKDPRTTLMTRVIEINVFSSFSELYKALPLKDLGYTEEEIAGASPQDMDKFYALEEQSQHGVVGFRLELLL